MKTKSELFQREKSTKTKKNPWVGYDFEKLPELTKEQLASFKPVTEIEFKRLKPTSVRKVGRPVKKPQDRESQISIRFKPAVLKKIKLKAKRTGFTSYQRFIKAILEKEVG